MVGTGEDIKGFVLRKENFEKPAGEWNTLELIYFEGQSLPERSLFGQTFFTLVLLSQLFIGIVIFDLIALFFCH
ncbi:hypothetical protein [Paraglaciecola sp.]|uniref:hypothetical protein n=1 Tax=Paraglaciecola sp. TaxID=1920173 RepID=UPI0030F377C8